MTKYFHPQVLVLYFLIDLFFVYVAYIVPKDMSASSLYPVFMIFLIYNIAGLYLLHLDIVESNPKLSKTTISFSDMSNANIQNLTSLSLMVFNFILVIMYGLQTANSLKKSNTSQFGGRRR
jgi:hypothetical protein